MNAKPTVAALAAEIASYRAYVDAKLTNHDERLTSHETALRGLTQAMNALLHAPAPAASPAPAKPEAAKTVPVTRVAPTPEGVTRATLGSKGKLWAWIGKECVHIATTDPRFESILAIATRKGEGTIAQAKAVVTGTATPAKTVTAKAPKAKRPLPINPATGERFGSVREVIAAHKARKAAALPAAA